MPEWTNCESWFIECGLDPQQHELWLGDRPPQARPDRKVFWLSHETRAMASRLDYLEHNVVLFDSGVTDDGIVNPFMMHWWLSVDANNIFQFTDRIQYQDTGLRFDALLGTQRPHRDFAYQRLQQDPQLASWGYITYHRVAGNRQDFHVDSDVDVEQFQRSSSIVEYQGQTVGYCSMIPTEIYSQTYISLVTETYKPVTDWSFMTEKISKPMLARRPFVVLSNRHYLRRLKRMGFETFDSVIDESYDDIENDQERWSCAMDQLYKMCEIPRQELLESIAPKLDHNYKMINQPWMEMFKKRIKELK